MKIVFAFQCFVLKRVVTRN